MDDLLDGVVIPVGKSGPAVPGQTEFASELAETVVYDANRNVAGGIQKVRYTHEDMIDFILANPGVAQVEIARRYGYTQGWVSRIISSDAFRAMYARRRDEVVDPVVLQEVEERFRALTLRSLDVVMEKLEANPTLDGGLKALEIASRAQGYGVAKGAQVQVNQNFVVALPEKAGNAADWLNEHSPAAQRAAAANALGPAVIDQE